ncbi:MAG TPA: amino acid ABC transporter ATP-binding protein [Acidimicrobiales bacterium]|jgi:polar amino acid transport system ATP-binding protein|nr:amino acid ABC transporter ATP-binding protein [Acidimicrobiales bacterium]
MSNVVLEMDSVVKRFGENEVLRGVSLELRRHEVVCLIGASGSGKSTLLRCVNLLERIDGGDIKLFGRSLTDPRIDPNLVRRHVGIVFQAYDLFPHMTVLDNVALGPMRAHKRNRDEVHEEALVLLERIGLKERANDYPERLSGGQQQRVAIVRSLAMRPSLLLLDEVTSALDPSLVGEVLDLLTDLAHQGTTMLIATHEMNFARDVAHEVAYLDKGVLVEKGTPEKMFGSPDHEATKNFSVEFAKPHPLPGED